ncbi:SDR family oxidoreductase [Ramlibacter rhizophilus]|uniref:SDR family NAD(P)-dependent oxidoreductase n=1 Tax=Ramlibacter rhizophilus TaxID=1781167 RepID=A0A4Z0BSS0_9BURK|nr:SDR family oxidoreductase [Ramlibacter rhizophilus]TFZ01049.1 SDR family NAD(P)-dependent oxidoreductase [Ramlibacter rhizophilus]
MKIGPDTVAVVTGASAGVGRAIAQEFARRGASVALLAREPQRLEQARAEMLRLGARQAIAIACDVAHEDQVEAAADRAERELGPIDVWINNAMVTIVAPVKQIEPEEFRRVTEVSYHGTVWGSLAALKRMRPRNRGSIVQVGSALAYRSIPLQAPYCGAKHAVRGFTESLRTELIYENSAIHLGMVELPAVNTPQFEWCRTRMSGHPKPLGTIYQPEVPARAVLQTVETGRRETYVAFSSAMAIWGDKLAPGLMDHYLAHKAYDGQQMDEPLAADRKDNLFDPVPGDFSAHGRFDAEASPHSTSQRMNLHLPWLLPCAAGLLALTLVAAGTAAGVRRR